MFIHQGYVHHEYCPSILCKSTSPSWAYMSISNGTYNLNDIETCDHKPRILTLYPFCNPNFQTGQRLIFLEKHPNAKQDLHNNGCEWPICRVVHAFKSDEYCVEQAVVYSTLPQEYSTHTFKGEVVAGGGGVEERSKVIY